MMEHQLAITEAAQLICSRRRRTAPDRSVIVAVTGIDGSGKGYVTGKVLAATRRLGLMTASVNIDGWLNLPCRRFSPVHPARHFYQHAIRFDEMFERLLRPLRTTRFCRLDMDFMEETEREYRTHSYEFHNVDVVIVEGIFLLKRDYRNEYDLSFWIDCTFETALERAIERAQEGLPVESTVEAYRTIYFPAQQIHFERDDPRASASQIIRNDPRISGVGASRQTGRTGPEAKLPQQSGV